MKKTILFDWDGTLARTLEVWLETFRDAYSSVGVDLTDKQIGAQFGNWNAPSELGVVEEDVPAYTKELEKVHARLDSVTLYDGAYEVLSRLKSSGHKLALVSTSARKVIDIPLHNNGLQDMFDVVISAEDTAKHKPDPEPLLLAVDRLESAIERTVFVGDSDKDVGACKNAQMQLALFTPESHQIFYDIDALTSDAAVSSSFSEWAEFPFDLVQ